MRRMTRRLTAAFGRNSARKAAIFSRFLTNAGQPERVARVTTTGSLEGLRERNKLRVVEALRQQGTASRSDLARATGLSRTTITSLVADLQQRGLVAEKHPGGSSPEPGGRGRPPTLLRLDPSAGTVLGV